MLNVIINITIFLLLAVLLYIGFYAGIIKSFFAIAAGFVAIVLAENYPYQFGINYYFIFFSAALIVYLIGLFIFKIAKFLYLSMLDKLAGACLSFFVWFILTANVVIPAFNGYVNPTETKTISYISNLSEQILPAFGKYIPNLKIEKKDLIIGKGE